MNFVGGLVLAAMQYTEEAAFWATLQLFEKLSLRELFDTSTLKFRLLTFQIDVLMRDFLPDVARQLHLFEVDLEVYTVKWFFSMFSIDIPFDYA